MGSILRVHALDLAALRSQLGSGEESFCAKVLRTIPEAAARRGLAAQAELLKDWKRGVTGLVLGGPGEALSGREPFGKAVGTKAGLGLSLAFASIVEAFAREGLGGTVEVSGGIPGVLVDRPLFGLEPDGTLVRWGALGRDEVQDLAPHPLIDTLRAPGIDLVGLSGSAWA
ncbi:MAG TPA: hypothetical protein VKU80_18800 [Planctomycetota bacterium]|nr:hypothetical protein [Planctomycetota bacterium]